MSRGELPDGAVMAELVSFCNCQLFSLDGYYQMMYLRWDTIISTPNIDHDTTDWLPLRCAGLGLQAAWRVGLVSC